MNSPLEAYDVLIRPTVIGFPFFGHGKKEAAAKKRRSSLSDQTQTTISTPCQHSSGKGIRYYLQRASLIQEAAAGAVAQRVSSIMDKVAHVSGGGYAPIKNVIVVCSVACPVG